jgi:MtN3 and saliva related transmembrane protein
MQIPGPEMLWETVGWIAALLTMFGFIPQILKIIRTKSVEDVSLLMILQYTVGIFLWLVYGVAIGNRILIVSNFISLVILLVTLGLYLQYKRNSFSAIHPGEAFAEIWRRRSPAVLRAWIRGAKIFRSSFGRLFR